MILKKKHPQKIEQLISYDDADELINKFTSEVQEIADKYGVSSYLLAVEWFAIKDGKRGSWVTHRANCPLMQAAALSAWIYGALRGQLDGQLSQFKNIAFQRQNEK